mgnify:CR=1 FL=1
MPTVRHEKPTSLVIITIIIIACSFIGSALVFAITVFVAIHFAPDQYAKWNGGEQGSLVAIK